MRRVLIITYYWPPSGGIAVLRCLKFAKYLRASGWEPVIFTAENAHYPSIDHSNDADIPAGIKVIREPIWEPYSWYKRFMGKPAHANVNNVFYTDEAEGGWKHRLAVWLRSNFFIPDARAMWIGRATRRLLTYLRNHPVDAILSDGPPHSNTRIATLVSRATGIPWLADFQDPWTQVDYYQMLYLMPWARRRHERMEKEALQTAALTTIVSPSWKVELERIGGQNVRVIYWGYDPDDFEQLVRAPHPKFTLTHLGIMGYDRNPEFLFAALQELNARLPTFAEHFELRLFGQVDHRVRAAITEYGLQGQVHFGGQVDRAVALQEMVNSHLLLLLQNQQPNAEGRIPGKLFEYLATRRPILNFGPPTGDVAAILESTRTGHTLAYDSAPAHAARLIEQAFTSYLEGEPRSTTPDDILPFSHPRLVKTLASYLDEIAA